GPGGAVCLGRRPLFPERLPADDPFPESPHAGLRPTVAAERQPSACKPQAIGGMGVDGECERFAPRRVTELRGDGRPEDILVEEVMRIGGEPLDPFVIAVAGGTESRHAPQREPAVADTSVEDLPRGPAAAERLPETQSH